MRRFSAAGFYLITAVLVFAAVGCTSQNDAAEETLNDEPTTQEETFPASEAEETVSEALGEEKEAVKEKTAEEKKEAVKKETAVEKKESANSVPDKAGDIPQPTQTAEPKKPTAQEAAKYVGKSAASLRKAIGEPSGKTYASSCIGEGEDGEWYYDGFTVYTYRDTDGTETVEDVF